MKLPLIFLFVLGVTTVVLAQTDSPASTDPAAPAPSASPKPKSPPDIIPTWTGKPALEIPLWNGNPPNMVAGAGPGKDDGTGRLRNVGIPSMFVTQPDEPGKNRRAVILFPGGAYKKLAGVSIGNGVLQPFLDDDFVVIVLKYRIGPPSLDPAADALADARRAVRLVREHATEWGIDPGKVGVIGWSAGGNVALNLVSHPDEPDPKSADPLDRLSSRPDFVGMLCPWPNKLEISAFPIGKTAPPAFIASARDDRVAPTKFSEAIAAEYEKAGAPVTFWQIDQGDHNAFSWNGKGEGTQWRARFMDWLNKTVPAN